MVSEQVPVIVGVGQFVERIGEPDYRARSPADLAAEAVRAAIDDAGGEQVLAVIDAVGAVRTFEDSTSAPSAFGKPDKFPLAVARRVGILPRQAILEKAGGQSPLTLLATFAERIAKGEIQAAVIFGAEAISTVRHLRAQGETRDWAEALDGEVEDHGRGSLDFMRRYNLAHGLVGAAPAYGLLENARRSRLGLSREDYAREMGRLFAPFTEVAAANPFSAGQMSPMTAEQIVTPDARNRMVADPYTVKLVSRDQVNQAAAVLIMSLARARALGLAEERLIYVHGCAVARELDIPIRPDPGASPAAAATLRAALEMAGKSVAEMTAFDFYSCFPIAVFAAAVDALGLAPEDPRGLTLTGGLPYFGGAGNDYSMHALASMTERLRAEPGAFGLVGANGGFISKYGAVVLSTAPAEWRGCRSDDLQAELDATPSPPLAHRADGLGRVLTYTISYTKGVPDKAIVLGELADGRRFLANQTDDATLEWIVANDPLGAEIHLMSTPLGNRFALTAAALPKPGEPALRDSYEFIQVERRKHIVEVTIDRPDVRNCLSPEANDELDSIFDAYEADPGLWVAILTGSGDQAFCAGADLRRSASGKPSWMPKGGFGGLTSRVGRTKPVIAAVNGIAFGGGFEICLAADLVVADPRASFGLTEVKVGVVAGAGGAVRLPRQLPCKLAMELLLTGRALSVDEAKAHGFVNRISAEGEALAAARELAAEIVAVSPTSVRLTMKAVEEADHFAHAGEAACWALESTVIDELVFSEDMAEGLAAFAAKRPPAWKNR